MVFLKDYQLELIIRQQILKPPSLTSEGLYMPISDSRPVSPSVSEELSPLLPTECTLHFHHPEDIALFIVVKHVRVTSRHELTADRKS